MISVLLVDDEPPLLDITQIFLEKDRKISVTLSESAADALEKLESGGFDIIVSDYEMPGMNGIEFMKAVQGRNWDIPFIIFTGRGREHVAIEALNLGASFYLQKGGDPKSQFAELRNMIMQAVQKKKAEDEVHLNQLRLQAMIDLYQKVEANVPELCHFALENAITLTGSRVGYLAFLNETETVLSMYAWSRNALEQCRIQEKPLEYLVEKTGLWGEPVRQRRAVITNDYSAPDPRKKGYPPGHVPLTRHLGVPIFHGTRIVMVVGLGNKGGEYDEDDVRQVTLLMGGLWQILKRKQTETELIESEKRMRSYFDLPLVGIAVISPDMRWLSVNDKLCRMLGYTREELTALTWKDLTPEEEIESELLSYQKVASGEKEVHDVQKKYRKKDGSYIDVEVSTSPVRRENGEVDYFVAVIQDVSPLKKAQEELVGSNQQMAETLEELRATQDSLNEYCSRLEREEQALRSSEEKFRTMVEIAPSLLSISDSEGKIVYLSPKWEDFTGYSFDDIMEMKVAILHPDDIQRVNDALTRSVRDQTGFRNLEFRAMKKNGEMWHASSSCEPLCDDRGQFRGLLIQTMDITPQKQAQEYLRRSQEKYRDLVESINDVVFSLDENGVITYASSPVSRVTGYELTEVIRHTVFEFMFPEDHEKVREMLSGYRGGALKETQVVELKIQKKDGDGRWVRIFLRPVWEGEQFAGMNGNLIDIHDQKKAQQALMARDALLQGIFRAAPIGIGVMTNRILGWTNHYISRLTGYTPEELEGQSMRILYPSDEEFRRVAEEGYQAMWENGVVSVETRLMRRDGTVLDVVGSASPLDRSDHGSPIIFTVSDITEQKKNQGALTLLNRKLSLLSRITRHDAGNRLNVMRGYIELMKEQTDDPVLLTYIHKEERAMDAVQSLLVFTESYQNVGLHAPSWQDVSDAIRRSAGMLELRAVTIYMDTSGLEVLADSLLEKVFYDLIENSLRYGGKATKIVFNTRETDEGLILVCEDDGVGIGKEEKERIFDLGYGENTGYGLFLVREVLSITNFSIRETGEEGAGARFEITIPQGSYRMKKGDEKE